MTFVGGRWTNVSLINAAVAMPLSNRLWTSTFSMTQSRIQNDVVIIDALESVFIDKMSIIDASRAVKTTVGAARAPRERRSPARAQVAPPTPSAGAPHGGNGGAGAIASDVAIRPPAAQVGRRQRTPEKRNER